MGSAKLTTSYWTIIKPYDLTDLIDKIPKLESQLDRLSNFPIRDTFSQHLCSQILSEIHENLYQILPKEKQTRHKRGLINIAGSFIKAITGNLDAKDGKRYEQAINSIIQNQKLQIESTNNRISVITNSLISINDSVAHINNNQKLINNRLSVIESRFYNINTNISRTLYIQETYSHLINILSHISHTLNNLLIAITFSKLYILHPTIISTSELIYAYSRINKFVPNQMFVTPNLKTLDTLEQITEIQAYHTENRVVFLLKAPLTNPIIYNLYHTYSLPVIQNQNTYLIIPTAKFLLTHERKYLPTNEPCVSTPAKIYLCKHEIIEPTEKQICELQLLEHRRPYENCIRHQIKTSWKIQKIEENLWLYFEPEISTGILKCKTFENRQDFKGSYLLRIPNNCTLQIHGNLLTNQEMELATEEFHFNEISLPKFEDFKTKPIINISLEDIHLDNIQELRRQLTTPPTFEFPLLHQSISIWTILLYLSLIIIFLCLIFRKFHHRIQRPKKIVTLDEIELH